MIIALKIPMTMQTFGQNIHQKIDLLVMVWQKKCLHSRRFMPHVSPQIKKVYGPTPFTPLSPASKVGYRYEEDIPSTQESTVTSDSLCTQNDPFDFDSELALIQDCELTDEHTRSLADSLKETQLELVARCLTPPFRFTDDTVVSDNTAFSDGTSTSEPPVSSSLHEAYAILAGEKLTVNTVSNVPLNNEDSLVTLEMHVGHQDIFFTTLT